MEARDRNEMAEMRSRPVNSHLVLKRKERDTVGKFFFGSHAETHDLIQRQESMKVRIRRAHAPGQYREPDARPAANRRVR